jgi:putative inorganic carbon (HCO3(-)) transporter
VGAINDLNHNDKADVIVGMVTDSISAQRPKSRQKPLAGAYMALVLFTLIYYSRPEDWIPGLSHVPLAKITGVLAMLALVFSLRHIPQRLPREVIYLALLVGQLLFASVLSPVWRGGAFQTTLDFAKVLFIVIVINVAVNTSKRLRLLIFIQAASVAFIAAVAVWKGRLLVGRLEGTIGGNYWNPNDLALAIVISLPLCLAFLLLSRSRLRKAAWALATLVMLYTVFLTGSRGGFIALIATAAVFLWEFAVRGRRRYLLVLAGLAGTVLWLSSNGMLAGRLHGTFNSQENVASAYDSAQVRQDLLWRSVEVTKEHPLFGVGPGNFQELSGSWHVTHNTFTEMSSEGGLPALILYVLILWFGIKNVRATKRFGQGQKELVVFAGGLLASLAGYVVGSAFASAAYQFFPYFLVAYTTALFSIAKITALRSKESKSLSQPTFENEACAQTSRSGMSWHLG